MNAWRKSVTMFLLLCGPLLTSGCWSSKEIQNRAIIVAAALDASGVKGRVVLTTQVVNPSKVRQGGPDAALLYTQTANTVFEGERLLQTQIPRWLFWGQIQVLVIGEELAKSGISELTDFFDREFEPNRRTWILVARGANGRDILESGHGFTALTANTLLGLIDEERHRGVIQVSNIHEAIISMETGGRNMLTGFVELAPSATPVTGTISLNQRVLLNGTAIFNMAKLVGYLDVHESRGVTWVTGKVRNALVVIPGIVKETDRVAIEVLRSHTHMKPSLQNGRPTFDVEVSVDAAVGEVEAQTLDLTKEDVLDTLNRRLANVIKTEIKTVVNHAKELQTDIFGFGEAFSRKYPAEWERIKNDWNDKVYPTVVVNVDVKAKIHHTGFLFRPLKVK